jgi:hypothetical protein
MGDFHHKSQRVREGSFQNESHFDVREAIRDGISRKLRLIVSALQHIKQAQRNGPSDSILEFNESPISADARD